MGSDPSKALRVKKCVGYHYDFSALEASLRERGFCEAEIKEITGPELVFQIHVEGGP